MQEPSTLSGVVRRPGENGSGEADTIRSHGLKVRNFVRRLRGRLKMAL